MIEEVGVKMDAMEKNIGAMEKRIDDKMGAMEKRIDRKLAVIDEKVTGLAQSSLNLQGKILDARQEALDNYAKSISRRGWFA